MKRPAGVVYFRKVNLLNAQRMCSSLTSRKRPILKLLNAGHLAVRAKNADLTSFLPTVRLAATNSSAVQLFQKSKASSLIRGTQ
jgi:hypothetical protein